MLHLKNNTSLPSPANISYFWNFGSPANISYFWNFGSLLGGVFAAQIATGLLLAAQFSADTALAFSSASRILTDVNLGWFIRVLHANGASAFFLMMYLHISRGMYFYGYHLTMVWMVGSSLLLLTMASAFLGYVLPWGQMSFWGASVITSLIQAIPYIGNNMLVWVWGGFSVDNPTLTRFFTLHFLLPFLMVALTAIHLLALHTSGSTNPLGVTSDAEKLEFHRLFTIKDILGIMVLLVIFATIALLWPWASGDPENFIKANPLVTPIHIQPEWYFLFAYAILRSIPNKLGGVLALVFSVLVLYVIPFLSNSPHNLRASIYKSLMWALLSSFLLLTWVGSRPVEPPFLALSQLFAISYFFTFLCLAWVLNAQNSLMK